MSMKKAPARNSSSHGASAPKRKSNRIFWFLTLPLTLLAAGALGALLIADLSEQERATQLPEIPVADSGPNPAAWTYDATNNRHWDPSHNHWHDGPPPPPDQRTVAPAATPENVEPWFYDEANNQHWDPGHNHWHPGPPPPPEEREVTTAPPSETAPETEPTPPQRD